MKKLLLTCTIFLMTTAAWSWQQAPGRHIIVKGDTWYSLARKYNVPYADLRKENEDFSDKLRLGDTLRIPHSADVHPEQAVKEVKSAEPANRFHKVKAGDNLSAIARKYGCSVNELMQWNKLASKNLKVGQKLIVGKMAGPVKKTEPLAASPVATPAKDTVALTKPTSDSIVPALSKRDSLPATMSHSAEQKMSGQADPTFASGRKEVTEEGAVVWIDDQDNPGKYFALHRTATIGTIIKVTNRMNRRVVFVKVVGKLPDTGDNDNIVLKISKAAAEKLGVIDARFQAQLNYGVETP